MARLFIKARVTRQGQIMRLISAGPIKPVTFFTFSNAIVNGSGIGYQALFHPRDLGGQTPFHLPQSCYKSLWIAAIEAERVKTTTTQMLPEPCQPGLCGQSGLLLDAAPISDHDGQGKAAIMSAPPTRDPITATLFLGRPIRQKGHQCFAL